AQIYLELGAIAHHEGATPGAIEHLRAAISIAETAGADRTKAVAGTELTAALVDGKQLVDASSTADQAGATIARLGGDPLLEARLAIQRARLASAQDRR